MGWAIARLVATPLQLVALAAIAAVADTASVLAGPTRTLVDEAPDAFELVALHLPPWDAHVLLGPVDVALAALFVAGAARVGLPAVPAAIGVLTGIVVATGAALGTGTGLPVVPFMAAGLLVAAAADRP